MGLMWYGKSLVMLGCSMRNLKLSAISKALHRVSDEGIIERGRGPKTYFTMGMTLELFFKILTLTDE